MLLTLAPLTVSAAGITTIKITTYKDTDYDATQDQSDPGGAWTWTESTNTFTLTGDIEASIGFVGSGDVIFAVSDTHTMTGRLGCSTGKLTINGGTLTINHDVSSCINVLYGLEIAGGATVNASTTQSGMPAVSVTRGNFDIKTER